MSDPTEQPSLSTEQQEIYVTIWAKAVDTQMHFNEMCVKSRQFGLAFVSAALGLGIVLLIRGQEFSIPISLFGGFDLHMVVLIAFGSAFALYAVEILDLNVYHKMLRGAVSFGEDFEQNYMRQIFDLQKGMTQAISHFSRYDDAQVMIREGERQYTYCGNSNRNAYKKIKRFYRTSISALCGIGVILFVLTAHFGHPAYAGPASHAGDGRTETRAQ